MFTINRTAPLGMKNSRSFEKLEVALDEWQYDVKACKRGGIDKAELIEDGKVIRSIVNGSEEVTYAVQAEVKAEPVAVEAPAACREEEPKVQAVPATKATFQFGHEQYQAFCNRKEYGAKKMLYISATRVGGTMQRKGSYSVKEERFVNYPVGALDIIRAAAQALRITE